jgi:hypothetical protein
MLWSRDKTSRQITRYAINKQADLEMISLEFSKEDRFPRYRYKQANAAAGNKIKRSIGARFLGQRGADRSALSARMCIRYFISQNRRLIVGRIKPIVMKSSPVRKVCIIAINYIIDVSFDLLEHCLLGIAFAAAFF